jgi:hypothetical protein
MRKEPEGGKSSGPKADAIKGGGTRRYCGHHKRGALEAALKNRPKRRRQQDDQNAQDRVKDRDRWTASEEPNVRYCGDGVGFQESRDQEDGHPS